MPALWNQLQPYLGEPLPAVLYASGWLLLLLLLGDIGFQTLPQLSLRKSKSPLQPMAAPGGLVTFAPTRRIHHVPSLFGIGYHLLILGLLAGVGVALTYRANLAPLLEAFWLVPLLPLREPQAGLAFLACGVLIWSGFRFPALRSASLAGFVLLNLCWVFFVAWVSLGRPLERLQQGSYPDPGLVRWVLQAGESAWGQKPHPNGFLFLGTGLFALGVLTIWLGYRRPKGKRRRLLPVAYLRVPARQKTSGAGA